MEEISEENLKRIEELQEIVINALQEIKELSNNKILYDHSLKRFIELC